MHYFEKENALIEKLKFFSNLGTKKAVSDKDLVGLNYQIQVRQFFFC